MHNYFISASLLSANFARLGEEADAVLAAGADMLHFDVMDHHYVPNLTVGPLVCESLRQHGIEAPIDAHLMTRPVDDLIIQFAQAGANYITIHPESTDHLDRSLELIRQHHCKAGIALNPSTTLECLEYIFDKIDLILLMSVNPGFGGQPFIPTVLKKLKKARELIQANNPSVRLSIDGGIKIENMYEVAKAGADTFVAGSAIFKQPNYAKTIQSMRQELKRL